MLCLKRRHHPFESR